MAAVLTPLNKAPDLLQRTAIFPKRRAPVSGGTTRTRFAKPRPNINALVTKTTKEVTPQEEEKISALQVDINKASEVSKEVTVASTTEPSDECSNNRTEENVPTSCDQAPEDEVVSPNSEPSTIHEKEPLEDPPCVESVEIAPLRPKSVSEAVPEKEISVAPQNKTPEYPTLKSILNSPRKKITTKKAHERRKRFANGTETPPRSEMTMIDLIYYNPSGAPMKSTKPQPEVADEPLPSNNENTAPIIEEETDSLVSSAPKVIINEHGEIIIDESSLVIARKDTVDSSAPVVENDNTTYSSFRKKTSKQWTNKETAKFYKALSLVGTDFALMENIFVTEGKVTRTRRELKLKFKREERLNTELVHQAMYETQTYDISVLDDDDDPDDVPRSSEIENESKKNKKKKINLEQLTSQEDLVKDVRTEPVVNKKKRGRKKKEKADMPEKASDFLDLIPIYSNRSVVYCEGESEIPIESIYCLDENGVQEVNATELPAIGPKISEVNSNDESNSDSVYSNYTKTMEPSFEKAPARSQRIRKAKVMSDFITDEIILSESDGEDEALKDWSITKSESNVDVMDDEFQVTKVKNVLAASNKGLPSKLPIHKTHMWETEGGPDDFTVVCLPMDSSKKVSNVVELSEPYSKNINSDNFLTDAAISEVVTSDLVVRRVKRKAAPNVTKRIKRPLLEMSQARSPSFTNFTPSEDSFNPPKYTYSKQQNMELSVTVSSTPQQFQTTNIAPVTVTPLQRVYLPAEVPDKHLPFKEHAEVAREVSFQVDAKLSSDCTQCLVPSLKSPPQPPLDESQTTLPVYNGDQSPMMFFTKSANNENILHLFVVNSPAGDS